jgi:hypothetical protein
VPKLNRSRANKRLALLMGAVALGFFALGLYVIISH